MCSAVCIIHNMCSSSCVYLTCVGRLIVGSGCVIGILEWVQNKFWFHFLWIGTYNAAAAYPPLQSWWIVNFILTYNCIFSLKQRHVVSLLKQKPDSDGRVKVRKGKQSLLSFKSDSLTNHSVSVKPQEAYSRSSSPLIYTLFWGDLLLFWFLQIFLIFIWRLATHVKSTLFHNLSG